MERLRKSRAPVQAVAAATYRHRPGLSFGPQRNKWFGSTSTTRAKSSHAAPPPPPPPPPSVSRSAFFRQFSLRLLGLMTWLPVAIWLNSTVAEVTRIEGPSMHPFLNSRIDESLDRDWVVNFKLYAQEGLQRGMVVFLRSPVHPETISVKRIIGLEGDVVQTRHPYPTAYVRVPPGHLWVEGDAGIGRSLDSNTYGPISVGLVTGRLSHILLPLSKAGRVRWWEHSLENRHMAATTPSTPL